MSTYFDNLPQEIKKYYKILSSEIPEFIWDYVQTPQMQRIGKISVTCGTCYTKICSFENRKNFSNLDHSIGVALIVWNFTKDKKQTLAGLFHDIATPVFKHCIDFLKGDYEKQEATEDLTTQIIMNSKEIMDLLKRDNIKVEEVNDYHKYPIADNDTPKLSSDRLEYTLSNGMGVRDNCWKLDEVKKVYENIVVAQNEENIKELAFNDVEIAERFTEVASQLSKGYSNNQVKLSMQFLADTIKKMSDKNLITEKDLYVLSEQEVIEKIRNCGEAEIIDGFERFINSEKIGESDEAILGKYCISLKVKTRYIIPLIKCDKNSKRITEVSDYAKKIIDELLNWKPKKYAYLNFNF